MSTHYGVYVDPEVPITGVCYTIDIHDDDYFDAIDLDCLECEREREHGCDQCSFAADCPDADSNATECVADYCMGCCTSCHTRLVGDWKQGDNDLWEPDQNGDLGYAAISREFYTQVVWSRRTEYCALCSLCYPGQGDLDSAGEFLTYALPEENDM